MRSDLKRFVASTSLVLIGGLVILAAQATRPEAAMRSAANALIAALNDEQRTTMRIPFDSDERMNWQFVPIARKGLPLKQMNEQQRKIAFELLKTGLERVGLHEGRDDPEPRERAARAERQRDAGSRAVFLQHLRRPGRRLLGLAL